MTLPNPPVPNLTTSNTPAPPYPLVPGPVKKSWLDRHARWKVPLGCLIVISLLCAFIAEWHSAVPQFGARMASVM